MLTQIKFDMLMLSFLFQLSVSVWTVFQGSRRPQQPLPGRLAQGLAQGLAAGVAAGVAADLARGGATTGDAAGNGKK